MGRTVRLGAMVLLSLAVVTSGSPAAARAETFTDQEPEVIEFTEFVPCAAGGAGEEVRLAGMLNILTHGTIDARGGYHAKVQLRPQGVRGEGLTTGDRYVGTGVTQEQVNGTVGSQSTFIDNYRIIGQGSGNNLLIHQTVHVTVNANGEVTASVDNVSVECR